MGLLDGGAARFFGELFKPLFLPATLRTMATTKGPRGAIRREPTDRACRAAVDRATERMVGTEGYSDTDRAIFILATSFEGEVNTDAEIEMLAGPYAGSVFKIASPIDRDPAGGYWLCRGMRGKPTGG